MKILLIVQREADICWVADACDEDTIDEAGFPAGRALLDADPANTRELWVEVPNGSLSKLWDVPTVSGSVIQ
jgi:hypothetical protein